MIFIINRMISSYSHIFSIYLHLHYVYVVIAAATANHNHDSNDDNIIMLRTSLDYGLVIKKLNKPSCHKEVFNE